MWIKRKAYDDLWERLDVQQDLNDRLRQEVKELRELKNDMAVRLDAIQVFAAPGVVVDHACGEGECTSTAVASA